MESASPSIPLMAGDGYGFHYNLQYMQEGVVDTKARSNSLKRYCLSVSSRSHETEKLYLDRRNLFHENDSATTSSVGDVLLCRYIDGWVSGSTSPTQKSVHQWPVPCSKGRRDRRYSHHSSAESHQHSPSVTDICVNLAADKRADLMVDNVSRQDKKEDGRNSLALAQL